MPKADEGEKPWKVKKKKSKKENDGSEAVAADSEKPWKKNKTKSKTTKGTDDDGGGGVAEKPWRRKKKTTEKAKVSKEGENETEGGGGGGGEGEAAGLEEEKPWKKKKNSKGKVSEGAGDKPWKITKKKDPKASAKDEADKKKSKNPKAGAENLDDAGGGAEKPWKKKKSFGGGEIQKPWKKQKAKKGAAAEADQAEDEPVGEPSEKEQSSKKEKEGAPKESAGSDTASSAKEKAKEPEKPWKKKKKSSKKAAEESQKPWKKKKSQKEKTEGEGEEGANAAADRDEGEQAAAEKPWKKRKPKSKKGSDLEGHAEAEAEGRTDKGGEARKQLEDKEGAAGKSRKKNDGKKSANTVAEGEPNDGQEPDSTAITKQQQPEKPWKRKNKTDSKKDGSTKESATEGDKPWKRGNNKSSNGSDADVHDKDDAREGKTSAAGKESGGKASSTVVAVADDDDSGSDSDGAFQDARTITTESNEAQDKSGSITNTDTKGKNKVDDGKRSNSSRSASDNEGPIQNKGDVFGSHAEAGADLHTDKPLIGGKRDIKSVDAIEHRLRSDSDSIDGQDRELRQGPPTESPRRPKHRQRNQSTQKLGHEDIVAGNEGPSGGRSDSRPAPLGHRALSRRVGDDDQDSDDRRGVGKENSSNLAVDQRQKEPITAQGDNSFIAPELGAAVVVNYKGRGKWFHAKVTAVHATDDPNKSTFDVIFENGKTQQDVPADMLRIPPSSAVSTNTGSGAATTTASQGDDIGIISAHVHRVANEMALASTARNFAAAKHRKKELGILDRHLRKLQQLIPKMEERAAAQRFDDAEAVQKNIIRSRKQMDKDLQKHHKKCPEMLDPYLRDPLLHPQSHAANGNKANDPVPESSGVDGSSSKKAKQKQKKSRAGSGSSSESDDSSSGSGSDSDSDSESSSNSSSSGNSVSGSDSGSDSDQVSSVSNSDSDSSSTLQRRRKKKRFLKGEKVVYRRGSGAAPKDAKVASVHRDGTYDIEFAGSNRVKERVSATKLEAKSGSGHDKEIRPCTASEISIGDSVEAYVRLKADRKGTKRWVPAKVVDVSSAEKAVAVKFLFDPDANVKKTSELHEKDVRWPGGGNAAENLAVWKEGVKVEARFQGKKLWLPGTVARIREDDSCDILYDGGAKEKKVKRKHVRLMSGANAAAANHDIEDGDLDGLAHKTRLIQEGALVQFNDQGDWVNAVVTRVYRNRRRGTNLYAVRVESDRTIRSDVHIDDLRIRSVFDEVEAFYLAQGGQGLGNGRGLFSVSRDSGRLVRLACKLSRKVRVAQEQGVIASLQEMFQAADSDADGFLSADELQDFLRALRAKKIPRRDCEELIMLFNAGSSSSRGADDGQLALDNDGATGPGAMHRAAAIVRGPVLSWGGFLRLTGVYDARQPSVRAQKIARVAGKLRRFFQQLLDRKDSDGLFRTFEDLDAGGSGTLSYSAFHYGLANMGLQLRADEAVLVCDQFDPEDDGVVDYRKFLRFCTEDEAGGEALIDYVRDRLLQECRTRAGHYDTAKLFRRLGGESSTAGRNDGDASGHFLSWHDFYNHCTRAYGMHLAAPRRRLLQKELRVSRSGRLSYKSFCEFLGIHMSAEELGLVPMQVDPTAAIEG